MQKHSLPSKLFLVIAFVAVILVLRILALHFNLFVLNIAFAVFGVSGIVLNSLWGLKEKEYVPSFDFSNKYRMKARAFAAAAGFFLAFILHSYMMYRLLTGGQAYPDFIFTVIMSSLLSVLSCVYFIIIALSCGDSQYDFREFKIIHLVPLLWTASEIFSLIKNAGDFESDMNSVIKYGMFIMLLLFFYRFAREADEAQKTKRSTLLTARLFCHLSTIYCADRLLLVLMHRQSVLNPENVLALTGVLLTCFIFAFERDVLYRFAETKRNTELC